MRSVRSYDTTPELIVRNLLISLGYRYRLHRRDIPGQPDIAFIKRRKVIFVHGCFWHGHDCRRGARQPKTNSDYWEAKIRRNVHRDEHNLQVLQSAGWQALIVWECETPIRKRDALEKKLRSFLG